MRPEEKADKVRQLQGDGYAVAMVGDGVNDAAALAQADLGMATGSGTDAAIGAADLTLVNGDPNTIAEALLLARATFTVIRGNLCWAFGYNAIAIPAAALGYLNPLFAGIAMAASSLIVTSNSLITLTPFGDDVVLRDRARRRPDSCGPDHPGREVAEGEEETRRVAGSADRQSGVLTLWASSGALTVCVPVTSDGWAFCCARYGVRLCVARDLPPEPGTVGGDGRAWRRAGCIALTEASGDALPVWAERTGVRAGR